MASHKIGECARPIGTLVQDRQSAIVLDEGVTAPIHLLALVAMGLPLFDECDLEDLGREAAKRKRWVFLFTAAPLAVPGGTGSPINPIATY